MVFWSDVVFGGLYHKKEIIKTVSDVAVYAKKTCLIHTAKEMLWFKISGAAYGQTTKAFHWN